ncbi:flagellar MS-ring protein [Salmonella bongori]|nr:flagellar MS-ring protein [Salmonella bongori]
MGFSDKRGDTLNVVNSPFTAVDETGGELPFWQQQSFIDQLIAAGRWLLVLLVAWILWRKAVRPQLTRPCRRSESGTGTSSGSSGNRRSRGSPPQQRRATPSNVGLTNVWAPR